MLKSLPDAGLGVASVLVNLHHRRIIPLMERELRIFKMDETVTPVFPKKTKCKPICMSGSSFMHIVDISE
jgi:hypothetical protein